MLISGHVTWVGKSSAESTLHLEQLIDGQWVKITEALFVLVARDPLNRGAAFINPLELVTNEEKELFRQGEENKKRSKISIQIFLILYIFCRRYQISQETLFKQIPNEDEQELVHDFFMKTVDHKQMSFKAR